MRFRGTVYRALNPVWAAQPLSGEGARRYGGRFNAKGTSALYLALTVMGAVREANRLGSTFEPITLVAYDADVDPVLDATDNAKTARYGVTAEDLADDRWRIEMAENGRSKTQAFAELLIESGFAGMLVPSYAPAAPAGARNLVLWRWGADLPARLTVVDTDGRLSK